MSEIEELKQRLAEMTARAERAEAEAKRLTDYYKACCETADRHGAPEGSDPQDAIDRLGDERDALRAKLAAAEAETWDIRVRGRDFLARRRGGAQERPSKSVGERKHSAETTVASPEFMAVIRNRLSPPEPKCKTCKDTQLVPGPGQEKADDETLCPDCGGGR